MDKASSIFTMDEGTPQFGDREVLIHSFGAPGLNAIDDSADSFWFNQNLPTSPPANLPSEIQVKLGQIYAILGKLKRPDWVDRF